MSREFDALAKEIFCRYGIVRRARGCFLYTAKNVRLTDLCQAGGRAVLGWGGGSATTVMKNEMSLGATGIFETGRQARLDSAASRLLCSKRRTIACTEDGILEARERFGGDFRFFRPWQGVPEDLAQIPAVAFVPPYPFGQELFLLALKSDCAAQDFAPRGSMRLPAPLLAAFARAICNLASEIPRREERHFFIYDKVLGPYWLREGPYLSPKVPRERYWDFVLHCLDCHIVVSPCHGEPSLVPFGADLGNFNLLKKNPFDYGTK